MYLTFYIMCYCLSLCYVLMVDIFLFVLCRMDSDDSNSSNDNEECWVEEDREFEMLCGLALKGIIIARNLRTPCYTSAAQGTCLLLKY